MDKIIKDQGNERTIDAAFDAALADDGQTLLIYGDDKSGKTTLLKAIERHMKDEKKPELYRAAMQIMNVLQFQDDPADFFDNIGNVPVLLLDDFQDFYVDESGPLFAKLMIAERAKNGFATIITSKVPIAQLDKAILEDSLDSFTEYKITALNEAGKIDFVLALQEEYGNGGSPKLSDEAVAFLANDFSEDYKDVENAVHYLMEAAGFDAGEVLTTEQIKAVLK